ncbi:MAG: hypothetical protein HPY45_02740 [Anaerolineae bacterium]|nr:hypothetical protein [Anaerolineae bacterium]
MNADILLDISGSLPAPKGFLVIENEVDFLKHATDQIPLLIQGPRLCAWAEAFYTLRKRSYRYEESLTATLMRLFPRLSREQAEKLVGKIGSSSASINEISAAFLLNKLYPSDSSLWNACTSSRHAAEWLLWIYDHHPSDDERIILEEQAKMWATQSNAAPYQAIYRVKEPSHAKEAIYDWLGLGQRQIWKEMKDFPLPLSAPIMQEIKAEWRKLIIESQGKYFEDALHIPLSNLLRQELAESTCQYYHENSQLLTPQSLEQLQRYLPSKSWQSLRKLVPPAIPSNMPEDEQEILSWFQNEYLPYRQWQHLTGDPEAAQYVHDFAKRFARWYLREYPRWLIEPGVLSFQFSAELAHISDALTLCIVLDGLPVWDAEDFARRASADIERLQIQQRHYCFASLPTITEFAKEALLKGMPPRLALEYSPLGKILSDASAPSRELYNAQKGDLFFWRIEQPDKAYHSVQKDKLGRQIEGELSAIVHELQQIVEGIPDDKPLRVIITTDHGRLFNARSPRCLPIPEGMQAHGRVAWGKINKPLDETGFFVDESARWIIVDGERFQVQYDLLIALEEESFRTKDGKSGDEPYPHGGLYPEEVIIPWFVFERDAVPPKISIEITGHGEANKTGTLLVKITNQSMVTLECLEISLSAVINEHVRCQISPLQETTFKFNTISWPTKSALPSLKAKLLFRMPNGKTFEQEIMPKLEIADELYSQPTLKDLGL